MSTPDRPVRARTRPGRLAALDRWVLEREAALLRPGLGPASVIDVGFGESPVTTRELAAALWRVSPDLPVIGVDRDTPPPEPEGSLRFLRGGFEAVAQLAPARLVRAVNVVRAYREEEVPAIHEALGAPLVEGGLAIEGSTDTLGAVTVVHLLRKTKGGVHREALLFHTDFSRGFSPWLFRDWLPRDFRRRVHVGETMHVFLSAWAQGFAAARERSPAESFTASIRALAGTVEGVDLDPWNLEHGFLRWAPRGGLPLAR